MTDAVPESADLSAPGLATDSLVRAVAAAPPIPLHDGGVRLRPGDVVDDAFEILGELGVGGMGAVYKAYDRDLDRMVALKLHRRPGGDAVLMHLRGEARAMARVVHPHVLTVHAVGLHRGSVFIAMEFAAGGSLRRWLVEPRSTAEIVAAFVQAGQGLAAAHRAGIVHRDFKPDNVLLDEHGAKVADFGLAGIPDHDADPLALAGAGTPAYMAPEQLMGQAVDGRADQFAFCVSLFEALMGSRPFAVAPIETLPKRIAARQLDSLPAPARPVPAELRSVLLRGMSIRPSDRFVDMDALIRAVQRGADAPRRRRRRWWTAAGLGAMAAGGVVMLRRDAPPDPCALAAQALSSTWDLRRAGALDARFSASDAEFVGDAWARARTAIDTYADAWKEARTQTCRAGQQGRVWAVASDHCLDHAQRDLGVLLDRLQRDDAEARLEMVNWANGLPPISECLDEALLAAQVPYPTDPGLRAEIGEIDQAVLVVIRGRDLDPEHAVEQSQTLLARAERVGYPPLVSYAMRGVAFALQADGDVDGSARMSRRAFDVAIAAGAVRAAVLAAQDLVEYHSRLEIQTERAAEWLATARTLGQRLDDVEVRAATEGLAAIGATTMGDASAAELGFQHAVALLREADPDHPKLGSFLTNLALFAMTQGDTERARTVLLEALALTRRTQGARHPATASILVRLAQVELLQSRPLDARTWLNEALAILPSGEHVGAQGILIVETLMSTAARLGEPEQAERYAKEAYELTRRVYGGSHHRTQGALVNWTQMLNDLGEVAKAKALLTDALAMEATDTAGFSAAYASLSESERKLGDLDAAVRAATRAIELNEAPQWVARRYFLRAVAHASAGRRDQAMADYERGFDAQPQDTALAAYHQARWHYAELLAETPAKRSAAQQIGVESMAFFSTPATQDDAECENIRAWLATLSAP